jgi:hypothetical protein
MPRLFGYTHTRVVEETCECRGDDACRVRIWWDASDETARERLAFEQRIAVLERRLEQFQETVAELVLAGDLETAMERVVSSVALSVRAPGFVLAIHPLPGLSRRVFSHGMDEVEALRVGAMVLANEPCPEIGDLMTDITSSRRSYGRLAVYNPHGTAFEDITILASYARLAATALDSATAIEEARRQAASGQALLELSAALADITSVEALAQSLVRATPAVVGADRAVVTIADRERGVGQVIAIHGYTSGEGPPVGAVVPMRRDVSDEILYVDHATLVGPEYPPGMFSPDAMSVVVPIDAGSRPPW